MDSFPKRIIRKHPIRGVASQDSPEYVIPNVYKGIMAVGAICFLTAAALGIWRISLIRGFALPSMPAWLPPHSHLMVGGFLGALIMFERMIGLRADKLVWVPYVYSLSAVLLHTGWWWVRLLHVLALLGWFAHRWSAYRTFHKIEKPLVESVAYATLSSALLYPGGLPARIDVALAGLSFPVATIIVERLEMGLFVRRRAAWTVLWMLIAWCASWIFSVWWSDRFFDLPPLTWSGLVTLPLIAGAAYCDTGLRISQRGRSAAPASSLYRFQGIALRIAYLYFAAAAFAMIFWQHIAAATAKDVIVHLLGFGFIFTMILAHAPFIAPMLLGRLPGTRPPWISFWIFQVMTIFRILGDLSVARSMPLWIWTGWTTGVLHSLSFVLTVLWVLRTSKPQEVAEEV